MKRCTFSPLFASTLKASLIAGIASITPLGTMVANAQVLEQVRKGENAGTATVTINGQDTVTASVPWFEPPTFTSEYDMMMLGRAPLARIAAKVKGSFPFTLSIHHIRVKLTD